MPEDVDLRFLGEQIKRLQGDVRQLKSDMALGRAEGVKIESDIAAVRADIARIDGNLDAFRETVSDRFKRLDDRFNQQFELIRSSFHTLTTEIQSLKKS